MDSFLMAIAPVIGEGKVLVLGLAVSHLGRPNGELLARATYYRPPMGTP